MSQCPDSEGMSLDLNQTVLDLTIRMSKGNPGACTVLGEILKNQGDTGFLLLAQLDDMGVYGSDIWIGYKDICGENIGTFIDKIRHDRRALKAAIDKVKHPIG